MARITYVKAAQQRYKMVPVLDAEGKQVETPVMRRDGTPKVTKHGRPVTMRQTVADKSQPLPMPKCESCGKTIEVGQAYKHVSPKSGPYGGYTRYRCSDCPGWQVWDLSNAWWARIAQATDGFDVSDCTTVEEVQERLEAVADAIRDLAQESEEAADNIEEGFGHETMQSQEARDRAEALNDWADEIADADIPDLPEPESETRYFVINDHDGSIAMGDEDGGYESEEDAQAAIDAYFKQYPQYAEGEDAETFSIEARDVELEEVTEEQMDEWRSEVESAVEIVNESPV